MLLPVMTVALAPIPESFFESAPMRLRDVMSIPLSAEALWARLTGESPFAWCRLVKLTEWTSPQPFGVGTTRTAWALGGALVLYERFFRWEEGRRQSFGVERASLPGYRRFAEDYLVEPVSESSCRFTWTIAAELAPFARAAAPVNAMVARSLFRDTRKHFTAV
jgi:polyketide cyclase/dehydrase/lipid transport protein